MLVEAMAMEKLYEVLVVEDEEDIRRSLSLSEFWKHRLYKFVGSASTAIEALEYYTQKQPDVILSDICLFEQNGLEMMKAIRDLDKRIQFVILSGYSKFEYAQKAVSIGVFEYLLKPIDQEKFDDTFQRLHEYLEQQESQIINILPSEIPVMREALLKSIISCRIPQEYIDKRLNDYQLNFLRNRYRIVVYNACAISVIPAVQYRNRRNSITFEYDKYLVDIIGICCETDEASLFSFIDDRLKLCPALAHCIGISKTYDALSDGRAAFIDALDSLAAAFFSEKAYIASGSSDNAKKKVLDDHQIQAYIDSAAEGIIEVNDSGARSAIEKLFHMLRDSRIDRVQDAYNICDRLILRMINLGRGVFPNMPFEIRKPSYCNCYSIGELEEIVNHFVDELVNQIKQLSSIKSQKVVWNAYQYIINHLNSPLSQSDIAKALYVSPTYLSRIFKNTIGINMNTFINEKKIEQAKQLIRCTHKTVQEVSYELGFLEYRYFSTVFRKHVGMSPLAYRKQLLLQSVPNHKGNGQTGKCVK